MSEPTPTPAPTPSPTPAPTPTPAPAVNEYAWLGEGVAADVTAVAQTKGWKSPSDIVTSYRNLETVVGAPPESIIKLPKEFTPETMRPIMERLGAGKTVDDYKLPVPEGDKGEFAKTAATWMHKHGVPVEMAKALAADWNAHVSGAAKTQTDAMAAASKAQSEALATEWGAALEQNKAIGAKAAREFGMTPEAIDALQGVMGYDGVMKFMHSIGVKMGEHTFESGTGAQGFNGQMTPAQAQAEMTRLRADPAFIKAWEQGDAEKVARVKQLNAWMHPDQK